MDEQNQITPSAGQKHGLDIISFFVTVGATFLLPIFFVPGTVSFPFQMGKAYLAIIAAIIAAALWIVARLRSGSISVAQHPLYFASVAVVGSLFLSALFSGGFSLSVFGNGAEVGTFGFLAAMFVLMFVVSALAKTRDRIFYLYLSLFASFIAVSLYHLVRLFFGADALSFGIFTSAISNTVGKWNDLGILFGLGAVLSLLTLELANVKAGLRYALYAVLVFSMFYLILVNFVSVWVAVALFSLMLFVYLTLSARRDGVSEKRLLPVTPLVVFVISLIFVIPIGRDDQSQMRYVGSKVNDALAAKFSILHLEVRPTWGATVRTGTDALKADPVFGAGPNHFTQRWLLSKPSEVNATAFWNADFNYGIGLVPSLLATTGIVGIVSWLAFLALLVYAGFRSILSMSREINPFSRYLTISSFFSALFLWLFTVIYVPSVVPVFLAFLFTGIFLGSLTEAGVVKTRELSFVDSPRAGFASVIGLVFLLVLAAVGSYVYTEKLRGAVAFQKGVFAFNVSGDAVQAEAQFKKAVGASGVDTYYRFLSELTLIKINTLLAQSTSAVNVQQAQQELLQLFGEAKLYAESARDANAGNYQNWLSLGRVYEALVPLKVDGAYAEALKAYDEALLRNPKSPEIYLTKARLEVANGKNDGARDLIREALALKPNYTEAVFFLSQIEVAEGNLKDAISSVEASIFLSPREPVLYFQLGLLKYNTSDYKGAVEALTQAVALNGSYANARYFLGLSLDRLGRTDEAIAQFEEILKTNAGNTEVQGIIDNLKAGKAPFASSARRPASAPLPLPENDGEPVVDTATE